MGLIYITNPRTPPPFPLSSSKEAPPYLTRGPKLQRARKVQLPLGPNRVFPLTQQAISKIKNDTLKKKSGVVRLAISSSLFKPPPAPVFKGKVEVMVHGF